jgi:hypothetical protein
LGREGGEGRGILMRLYTGSELGFLFGEHAYHASSDLMMDNCFVVFTDNINSKFLFEKRISEDSSREGGDETYDNVAGLELERL